MNVSKSVLVDQLAAFGIETQDTPWFLVKPEEPMAETIKRLAGKAARAIFWDPKIPFDREAFQRGKEVIGSNAIVYDGYQGVSWKQVKEEIKLNVLINGCKDVVLDPLTMFTVGMSLTQQNEELVSIASEFAAMANELDFTGYIFCHLNRPDGGPPHERGGAVQSVQFAGSRAMMR